MINGYNTSHVSVNKNGSRLATGCASEVWIWDWNARKGVCVYYISYIVPLINHFI